MKGKNNLLVLVGDGIPVGDLNSQGRIGNGKSKIKPADIKCPDGCDTAVLCGHGARYPWSKYGASEMDLIEGFSSIADHVSHLYEQHGIKHFHIMSCFAGSVRAERKKILDKLPEGATITAYASAQYISRGSNNDEQINILEKLLNDGVTDPVEQFSYFAARDPQSISFFQVKGRKELPGVKSVSPKNHNKDHLEDIREFIGSGKCLRVPKGYNKDDKLIREIINALGAESKSLTDEETQKYKDRGLILAADRRNRERVQSYLKAGADIDAALNDGTTALWIASYRGYEGVVKCLVESGANKDAADKNGATALIIASQNGHWGVVKCLVESGANKDAVINKFGITALYIASQNGHWGVVKCLVDNGADKDVALNDGSTALIIASQNGHEGVVKYLVENGANKDVANKFGATALMIASQNGHLGVVKCLVENGADKDVANKFGTTALMIASQNGHEGVVKCLVENGADKDAADEFGATALMIASQKGHWGVVKCLVENGADKDVANKFGTTALIIASLKGHEDVVKCLVENGADKDAADKDGATALYIASQNGHEGVVKCLVENGANKDKGMYNSFTPLMGAALCGRRDVVELLLNKMDPEKIKKQALASEAEAFIQGKDIKISDGHRALFGKTAADMAREKGHNEIADMIDAKIKELDGKWVKQVGKSSVGPQKGL